MRSLRDLVRLAPLFAVLVLWACGTTTEPDPDPDPDPAEVGSVTTEATTTGPDQDDGYTVAIGSLSGTVSANGSVTIASVPVGTASVMLGGVAANCEVTTPNPASVAVTAGSTATATFAVVCEALATGDADALLAEALEALETAMFAALNSSSLDDLDTFSFEEANDLFGQVLGIEPSNEVAAFGEAITTIFMLEDNEDLRAAAEEWEAWIEEGPDPSSPLASLMNPGSVLGWERTSLPLDFSGAEIERLSRSGLVAMEMASAPTGPEMAPPPDVSGYRTILLEIVIPAIDEALESMAIITDPDFEFTVTAGMQGEDPLDAGPLELDLTEVHLIQAGLEVAVAAAQVFMSYSFDPSPIGSPEDVVAALTPGSTFLQLESDGEEMLEDALGRLRAAAVHLLAGLDHLESETDDQANDILKFGVDGVDQADVDEAQEIISDVRDALSAPTDITFDEGESDEYTLTLDAQQFFLNPRPDLKAVVPPYEVFVADEIDETEVYFRWQALNIDTWDFPDPTFGGLFPGMTQEELRSDVGFGEFFHDMSIVEGHYTLISIDGVDCAVSGFGCQVDNDFYFGGWVDLGGYDGMSEADFYVFGGVGTTSAIGPYTVSATAEPDEYSVELNMVYQQGGTGALDLTVDLVDQPGYAEIDTYGRTRGGSIIRLEYLDAMWVFERQY